LRCVRENVCVRASRVCVCVKRACVKRACATERGSCTEPANALPEDAPVSIVR
jgi:hypothetical protein